MTSVTFLDIPIEIASEKTILEHMEKYLSSEGPMYHVVSLNPENVVESVHNEPFKKVYLTAQTVIADGIGVVMAVQMLKGIKPYRIAGVDLMESMIKLADKMSYTVLFIGGKKNLALQLSQCYEAKYPNTKCYGIEGFKDVLNPTKEEEKMVVDIVTSVRPRFVFTAFGSPKQELWLWVNRKLFVNTICMGVGGAFDYKSGLIPRAPMTIRKLGFEWLFRLIVQPWRIGRQKNLFTFISIVFSELRRSRLRESIVK